MKMKSAPLNIVEELGDGEFLAYAATFHTRDSYGDVMHKNSFDEDIAAWETRDDVMPVLWNHDTSDPKNNVGEVKARKADDTGYLVHAKFDLDTHTGAHVHRLVKGRRVTQLSFAYDELAAHPVKGDPRFGDYKSVDRVAVHEVSITPYGANRSTHFLGVKSAMMDVPALKAALDALAANDADLDDDTRTMLKAAVAQAHAAFTNNDAMGKASPSGTPGHGDSRTADELLLKFEVAGLPAAFGL